MSGGEVRTSREERMSGGEVRTSGEERTSGGEVKTSGGEERTSGGEERTSGGLERQEARLELQVERRERQHRTAEKNLPSSGMGSMSQGLIFSCSPLSHLGAERVELLLLPPPIPSVLHQLCCVSLLLT